MPPYTTNLEHLLDEFHRLDWLLERAIQQFRLRRNQDVSTEFQGLHISDHEIDGLISDRNKQSDQSWIETQAKAMKLHGEIQQRIAEAQAAGVRLRLPYLQQTFQLNQFETDLLLLALAPELDLCYQKLYAYLQDDVTRKRPSIDLALRLFCCSLEEQVKAREAFIKGSPLLEYSLLLVHEDPTDRPSPFSVVLSNSTITAPNFSWEVIALMLDSALPDRSYSKSSRSKPSTICSCQNPLILLSNT